MLIHLLQEEALQVKIQICLVFENMLTMAQKGKKHYLNYTKLVQCMFMFLINF